MPQELRESQLLTSFGCVFPCFSLTPAVFLAPQADGFITYYAEDKPPFRPVQWRFFDGAVFDVSQSCISKSP